MSKYSPIEVELINILSSIITGAFAVFIYLIVIHVFSVKQKLQLFGIVNKWIVLSAILFIFGFAKHQYGYYLTVESNYCQQTDVCEKLIKQAKPKLIDNVDGYLSFLENIWIESLGEGLVFVFVGLPLFFFFKHELVAAFFTGILSHLVAEYSGIHNYFCKKSCNSIRVGVMSGRRD